MPRLRTKIDRPSEYPEADQKRVRLQVDDMDTPVNEEEVLDNEANLIQNATTQPEQRPRQLKLPNFLSSPIDNLANYLGPVSPGMVVPRSGSADRKLSKIRTEGGGWAWTRVQSLDRERREVAPILSFIGPRSACTMNMGAVCQMADPYQEEVDHDEAAAAAVAAHNAEADEVDEDSIPSKDADCLIG